MNGDKCNPDENSGECTNSNGSIGLHCNSESLNAMNYCLPLGFKESHFTPYGVMNTNLALYNYEQREKTGMKLATKYECPSFHVTFNSRVNSAESFCGCCETNAFLSKQPSHYT